MKYVITYLEYDGKPAPIVRARSATKESLASLLAVFDDMTERFELLSIVPVKED